MAKKDDSFESSGAEFENNEDGLLVDMSNVEAMKFEAVPAGSYNCTVTDAAYAISKTSGKPMWNLTLTIVDDGEFQNRKLFTFLSFSEKALGGTKTTLSVLAPELNEAPFNPKNPEIVASLIGRNVKVKTKIEKYNDEDQSRISKWFAPDSSDGFIG